VKLRPLKLLLWLTIGIFIVIAARDHSRQIEVKLGDASVFTGWFLFLLMFFLALFNLRKRLSMIPLGSAATWLKLHVAGGVLAVPLFYLHTGTWFPHGLYEQIMTVMFYLLTVNGILGYLVQKVYPTRLTQRSVEVIYERIPAELAQLRVQAEDLIMECARETSQETLASHYFNHFDWFFREPRFYFKHLVGSQEAEQWVRYQCATIKRYLSKEGLIYLDRLEALAETKNDIDFHFAGQGIMKIWLLFHIPLAMGLIILIAWHIFLVHVYIL